MATDMNFGEQIKKLRKARYWTQKELAYHSGLSRSHIARLEQNRRQKVMQSTITALAKAFGYSTDNFMAEIGLVPKSMHQETVEEILDRFRIAMPSTVPIYEDFPFHAGKPVEPMDYVPVVKDRAKGRNLEAYIAQGKCLEPDIKDGDVIIVDRDGQIDSDMIMAALFNDMLHLGRLRKIAGELWLENNNGRVKLEDCQVAAPVIEVRRRLK